MNAEPQRSRAKAGVQSSAGQHMRLWSPAFAAELKECMQ